jgi:hypothetical protein
MPDIDRWSGLRRTNRPPAFVKASAWQARRHDYDQRDLRLPIALGPDLVSGQVDVLGTQLEEVTE